MQARDLDYETWSDAVDAMTPPSEPDDFDQFVADAIALTEVDELRPGPQHCSQCGAMHTDDNHVEAESESCEACKWEYGCEFVPLRGAKPVREYDQPTECLACGCGPIRLQDDGFCSYGCQKDYVPF